MDSITDLFHFALGHPSSAKVIAGDFNLPNICWSSLSALSTLQNFISCMRLGEWSQYVRKPMQGTNILYLLFSLNITVLMCCKTSSDQKVVLLISALPRTHNPIPKPPLKYSPCAKWALFPTTIGALN